MKQKETKNSKMLKTINDSVSKAIFILKHKNWIAFSCYGHEER